MLNSNSNPLINASICAQVLWLLHDSMPIGMKPLCFTHNASLQHKTFSTKQLSQNFQTYFKPNATFEMYSSTQQLWSSKLSIKLNLTSKFLKRLTKSYKKNDSFQRLVHQLFPAKILFNAKHKHYSHLLTANSKISLTA